MPEQSKHGFDPQQHSGQGQPQQQGSHQGQGDHELVEYLMKEMGHTKESAEAEVKRNRENVARNKKQHDDEKAEKDKQAGK